VKKFLPFSLSLNNLHYQSRIAFLSVTLWKQHHQFIQDNRQITYVHQDYQLV